MSVAERGGVRGVRRFGGLLRERDFRLLWVGESVSEVGNAMAVVGVPLLAVAVLHASTFAVSSLTAAAYLPWVVIGLPAGAWVDRLGCRPLMVVCDVVSALLFASLPAAAWLHVLTIGQVVVVALLAGAVNVFFATAYHVYLPSLVAAGDLVEGNAKLQGSAEVALVGGRGAAGVAARAVGYAAALLFNAASFLVSAVCLLCIRARPAPRRLGGRITTVRAEVAEGLRFVAGDRYLRPLAVYAAVANLAYSGGSSLIVVFLVRVVGLSAVAVGLLMAAGGVGGAAGALAARRLARWLGTARAVLLSYLGAGLCALLIPLTAAGPRVVFLIAGLAVAAAGGVVGNVIVGSFRQAYCPAAMLGRVSTGMRFLAFGAIPLGALLAGVLGSVLAVRTALWAALAVYAVAGLVLLTRVFRWDRDFPAGVALGG